MCVQSCDGLTQHKSLHFCVSIDQYMQWPATKIKLMLNSDASPASEYEYVGDLELELALCVYPTFYLLYHLLQQNSLVVD